MLSVNRARTNVVAVLPTASGEFAVPRRASPKEVRVGSRRNGQTNIIGIIGSRESTPFVIRVARMHPTASMEIAAKMYPHR